MINLFQRKFLSFNAGYQLLIFQTFFAVQTLLIMAFIWLVMRNSSTRMATHFVICDGLTISTNFFLPQQHFKFKSKSSEITLCIVKMTYFTEFFKLIAIILGNVNWRCVEFCLSSVISVLDF